VLGAVQSSPIAGHRVQLAWSLRKRPPLACPYAVQELKDEGDLAQVPVVKWVLSLLVPFPSALEMMTKQRMRAVILAYRKGVLPLRLIQRKSKGGALWKLMRNFRLATIT